MKIAGRHVSLIVKMKLEHGIYKCKILYNCKHVLCKNYNDSFSFIVGIVFINNFIFFGPVGRVFANDPGYLSSIPGRVITKTLKNGT